MKPLFQTANSECGFGGSSVFASFLGASSEHRRPAIFANFVCHSTVHMLFIATVNCNNCTTVSMLERLYTTIMFILEHTLFSGSHEFRFVANN
eukprot:m.1233024 g.1233024  ORF g.1233024 m.1233024 type:complete len:93 (-) comp24661_c2_seq35:4465-4743(-)